MRVLLQKKDEWKISFRNIHDFRGLVALQLQQCKIIEALFTAEAGRAQALGVTNGKIRALPRRRDPSLKIRARALNLFVKSEPES